MTFEATFPQNQHAGAPGHHGKFSNFFSTTLLSKLSRWFYCLYDAATFPLSFSNRKLTRTYCLFLATFLGFPWVEVWNLKSKNRTFDGSRFTNVTKISSSWNVWFLLVPLEFFIDYLVFIPSTALCSNISELRCNFPCTFFSASVEPHLSCPLSFCDLPPPLRQPGPSEPLSPRSLSGPPRAGGADLSGPPRSAGLRQRSPSFSSRRMSLGIPRKRSSRSRSLSRSSRGGGPSRLQLPPPTIQIAV